MAQRFAHVMPGDFLLRTNASYLLRGARFTHFVVYDVDERDPVKPRFWVQRVWDESMVCRYARYNEMSDAPALGTPTGFRTAHTRRGLANAGYTYADYKFLQAVVKPERLMMLLEADKVFDLGRERLK